MEIREHLVDFLTYCGKCKYVKVKAEDDPCDDCLTHPVNVDSTIPTRFVEAEDGTLCKECMIKQE